jgi:hypothetical protein
MTLYYGQLTRNAYIDFLISACLDRATVVQCPWILSRQQKAVKRVPLIKLYRSFSFLISLILQNSLRAVVYFT